MNDMEESPLVARKKKVLEDLQKAKLKLQKIQTQERKAARKDDTRRKILLGAKLLEELRNVKNLDNLVFHWISTMQPRDKPLFTELAAELAQRRQNPPQG